MEDKNKPKQKKKKMSEKELGNIIHFSYLIFLALVMLMSLYAVTQTS